MTSSLESDAMTNYPPPRPLRILVVDDERDTVMTLTAILSDEGHDVVGVHSGAEVMSAMQDFDPDAVLLDIAMPEMSGYEVAKEIRRRYGEVKPLLIAISGRYKQASDRVLAEIVGFNEFLTKPYETRDLLELLKN